MLKKILLSVTLLITLSACSELELGSHMAKQIPFPSDAKDRVGDFKVGNPYQIKGKTYSPSESYRHTEVGVASWYGPGFHGKQTANGEIFNKYELTAAHKTLQMPSIARVTNLENGRSIIVRINDRGPFSSDRIIDLSEKAAEALKMKNKGTARVRVDVLEKESRMVASAAKKGISTRGTELALNRGRRLKGLEMDIATPIVKPALILTDVQPISVSKQILPEEKLFNQVLVEQISPVSHSKIKPVQQVLIKQNNQLPNTINSTQIISKPNKIVTNTNPVFVQTGAFSNEDNAMTMKMSLYNINEPINIYKSVEKNVPIYKVKIGPISTVDKAQEILTLLNNQGRDARLIVAQN